jgi:hypothetical protein
MGRVVAFLVFLPVLCLIAIYKGLFSLPTGDGGRWAFQNGKIEKVVNE